MPIGQARAYLIDQVGPCSCALAARLVPIGFALVARLVRSKVSHSHLGKVLIRLYTERTVYLKIHVLCWQAITLNLAKSRNKLLILYWPRLATFSSSVQATRMAKGQRVEKILLHG